MPTRLKYEQLIAFILQCCVEQLCDDHYFKVIFIDFDNCLKFVFRKNKNKTENSH